MTNETNSPQAFSTDSAAQSRDEASALSNSQPATDIAADIIGETEQTDEPRDKSLDFNELINGEYKAEFQSAIENVLSKRLKNSNKRLAQSEQYKTRLEPLIDYLAKKYSVDDPSDVDAIINAAQNEYFEENDSTEIEFQNQFNNWLTQADDLKQKYPSFDFNYESTNEATGEQFRKLLNSGIDVETAFTVIHKNEIMGGAMQYAYKTAKQEMADARTSRFNRPSENGTSSRQASASSKKKSEVMQTRSISPLLTLY